MTSFSIDVNSANAVAGTLESEEAQMIAYVKQTVALAEEMAQTWIGAAPKAFQEAKFLWDEGMRKMDIGMANACTVLRTNASSYQNTDASLSSLFSSFSV
jgi:WXG100 family type VII secretion target